MYHFFKKLLYLLCILTISYTYSNELYYDKLSNESPARFVENSNLYINNAVSDSDRLSILYFTARSYFKLKENVKAISCLVDLEKSLDRYTDAVEATQFYGKMAYLYSYLKYTWKSKAMLEKSNEYSFKSLKTIDKYEARSYFYYYTAKVYSVNGDLENAISYYKLADSQYIRLSNIDDTKNPRLGHNIAVNLGDTYYQKKNIKSAMFYNLSALKRFDSLEYAGTVYLNLGNIYSIEKKNDSALFYYKKSIFPLQSENNIEYLNESFDSIESIYTKKNDKDNANHYRNMQLGILKKLENMDNSSIRSLTDTNKESSESFSDYMKPLIILLIILLIMLVLVPLFLLYISRRKNKAEITNIEEEIQVIEDLPKSDEEISISTSFQKQLIKSLEEYEKTKFYLDSNITLAKVAVNLHTNTRSLSGIINKYKKMNFSSYINHLRIQYIMRLLQDEVKYRNYKIAYLANICGFSSHSTFTKIFKSINGISPSEFIDMINANSQMGQ